MEYKTKHNNKKEGLPSFLFFLFFIRFYYSSVDPSAYPPIHTKVTSMHLLLRRSHHHSATN